MIKLNVTFHCSLPCADAHPYGEEVAIYLGEQLAERGVSGIKIDNWRDCGWSIDLTFENKDFYLAIGFVGDGDFDWLLQIQENRKLLDFIRRKDSMAERGRVAELLHELLRSDNSFSEIKWHSGDFTEEGFSSSPST